MGALDGLKIIDLSQIMAGPYCTMVLADLGAEIIKVEKVNGGDDTRLTGPFVNGESISFFQINRNKKSIALNLKTEEGKKIFYLLAEEADVIVENFRPGVTASLGIDYQAIKNINDGIIYCSISGFGQTGPYSHKGGFDLVAQGMTGLMSMTGEKGKRPFKSGVAVYDIGAGITAVYSILAAYVHKMKTGKGQQIDLSLAEIGLPWFAWEAAAYFTNGKVPEATGHRHRSLAPYQAFKTKDSYLMLGCANQRNWEKFCIDVIEKPEWIKNPLFIDNAKRMENIEVLESEIESVLVLQDNNYWLTRCEKAGVPAGPINTFDEAMKDPHYLERGMIQEIEHPVIGKMKTVGIPTFFSETPGEIRTPAPLLGQHTDQILSALNFSDAEIEQFEKKGVTKSSSHKISAT
ncbi:CaiB/BaiF CoA-transferase family protein [Bacillus sp. EB600]|uniref:CaiB/BaiF CoA transferase family protein n=1 Tax=Bacillus sp. EB600 TaxID=2806345 RepID=UPI00210DC145|nr:CoA transferase [Bacillus sp. EB600]MCQ6279594.1 CoA transferase [Bacillus sp. EB600]